MVEFLNFGIIQTLNKYSKIVSKHFLNKIVSFLVINVKSSKNDSYIRKNVRKIILQTFFHNVNVI